MHGSTLVPWIFFGPLVVMMVAKVIFDVTGSPWAGHVAKGALAIVVVVMATAFLVHFRRYRQGRRDRAPAGSADETDGGTS